MSDSQGGLATVKSPQDFAAGLFMVILGIGAWYFAKELPLGRGANLGPGSFPIGVSIIIACLGALLCFNATRYEGEALDWRFVRMLSLLLVLGVIYALLEALFTKILTAAGIPSRPIPWSSMLPAVVLVGLVFTLASQARKNETVARWVMRGPLFIVTAICMFALLIRPMGLLVAAPVLILLATQSGDEKVDWKETAIFAAVMTGTCIVLFRVMLRQAIPIAPWAGY
jgi:Tripartite tricarboxylate transporter TctB family